MAQKVVGWGRITVYCLAQASLGFCSRISESHYSVFRVEAIGLSLKS